MINDENVYLLLTGSQHSGTYEDDFNNSNDLPDTTHHGGENSENSQPQVLDEDDDDEDGIDCRCFLCERQCGDVDL